jgi:hypothetical protein
MNLLIMQFSQLRGIGSVLYAGMAFRKLLSVTLSLSSSSNWRHEVSRPTKQQQKYSFNCTRMYTCLDCTQEKLKGSKHPPN